MNILNQFRAYIGPFITKVWILFLNGLFALLPITITIAVFTFSFRLVKDWLKPVQQCMPTFLTKIPHSEILLVIAVIFLMGAILRVLVLRSIIHAAEGLIAKTPLIRPIYIGIKQLVHAFSPNDTFTFKKVVLIEFPRPGAYSIGFVTSEVPNQLKPTSDTIYFCVFVPTTPNPTTGFFVFLKEQEITVIDLTRQEAMALIISGGIIQPERFVPHGTNVR